jgi:hypothetical protein
VVCVVWCCYLVAADARCATWESESWQEGLNGVGGRWRVVEQSLGWHRAAGLELCVVALGGLSNFGGGAAMTDWPDQRSSSERGSHSAHGRDAITKPWTRTVALELWRDGSTDGRKRYISWPVQPRLGYWMPR